MEGNLRFKIDWASQLSLEGNLPVLLWFTLYLKAIFKYKPPGGLYLEGRFNGGFFALRVWGAYIWRGLFSEFYGIRISLIFRALGTNHMFCSPQNKMAKIS